MRHNLKFFAVLMFFASSVASYAAINESEAREVVAALYSSAWAGDQDTFYGLMSDDIRFSILPSSTWNPVCGIGKDSPKNFFSDFFTRVQPGGETPLGDPEISVLVHREYTKVISTRQYRQDGVVRDDTGVFILERVEGRVLITDLSGTLRLLSEDEVDIVA